MYVRMYVCMYVCTYVYMYVCIHVPMHVSMCLCMHRADACTYAYTRLELPCVGNKRETMSRASFFRCSSERVTQDP